MSFGATEIRWLDLKSIILFETKARITCTSLAPRPNKKKGVRHKQNKFDSFFFFFKNFRCSKALGRLGKGHENVQLSNGKSFVRDLGTKLSMQKFQRLDINSIFSGISEWVACSSRSPWNNRIGTLAPPQIYRIILHNLPFWTEKQFTGDETTFSGGLLIVTFPAPSFSPPHTSHTHTSTIPIDFTSYRASHSTSYQNNATSKENQTTYLMSFINLRTSIHGKYSWKCHVETFAIFLSRHNAK